MLVEEFSRYLKINKSKKYNSSVILLEKWLQLKLEMPCDSNVNKILHREIYIAKNKLGCCFFVAKSESGRVLLKALYNFCEYYDNYQKAKQNNM
ncbi:MAG: hypothetical protein MRZ90_02630 [Candidatus Gastranaerophilales bacterium]|nr:hypothetical protein [Candidatus Gastranaerophilales bacterium]